MVPGEAGRGLKEGGRGRERAGKGGSSSRCALGTGSPVLAGRSGGQGRAGPTLSHPKERELGNSPADSPLLRGEGRLRGLWLCRTPARPSGPRQGRRCVRKQPAACAGDSEAGKQGEATAVTPLTVASSPLPVSPSVAALLVCCPSSKSKQPEPACKAETTSCQALFLTLRWFPLSSKILVLIVAETVLPGKSIRSATVSLCFFWGVGGSLQKGAFIEAWGQDPGAERAALGL